MPKKPKRLTRDGALIMVEQIETLETMIEEVYAEARKFAGHNNDSVIREIVEARRAERDRRDKARGLLDSFQFDENGAPLKPPNRPATARG